MELTPIAKALNIAYQPHPVAPASGQRAMYAELDGKTPVSKVLLMAGIDPYQPITVQLDGQMLTVDEWETVCPVEGQLISVHATVQGGGGGSDVLQIVAIIAVVALAAVVAGPAGIAIFGTVGAPIASAVISVAGSLLIGAIFAPKPPSMPNSQGAVSPTYNLSGGSNRARPYEPMPFVMGTHRLFFDYGARPYTEYRGNDQYLYQIFNNSLGLVLADDFKIGTTPLNSYVGWSISASDANGKLANFPSNVDTLAGATLTNAAGYIERTTSPDTYQIGLDFESVLFFASNNGSLQANSAQLEIQYKLSSSGTWLTPSTLTIYGDNFTFNGTYLTTLGSSQKPNRGTVYISNLTLGTYDVRVRRITADQTDPKSVVNTYWSTMRSYQQDDSDYLGQNRIGLIIRATEQLNNSVQQLSATVVAEATYWNGTAWVTGATSNPAHWFMHFARGVYNSANKLMYGIGLSESQLDLPSLSVWANFCATENLTFNGVIDSTLTCADVLTMLGTVGFGSASWASGKLGVVFDARNASPVMAFGMSNIIRDSFEVSYISENLAEEIIVRFSNADQDYEQQEVRVLAPNVVTPTRTSAIDLFGCTNADMAGKFANYIAAQQYYRRRRVTWQSDFEGFVCQRGDVVLLSHDLTQWGYSGRFVGANSNVITLDRTVPRQNQIEYLMLIRPDGTTSTYDVQATTATESDTLTIINDVVTFQSGANLIDHRWCFSPLETVGKKLKILSVQPASDARLTIVATDEYDEFYDAWNGTFVQPPISTVLPLVPVSVSNLTATNRVAFVNGYLTNRVTVNWGVSGSVLYSSIKVYLDGNLILSNPEINVPDIEIDIAGAGSFYAEVTPYGLTGAGLTVTTALTLSALDLPSPPTSVTLEVGEDGRSATYAWTPVLGVQSYVVEIFANGAVKRSVNVGNTLSYVYSVSDSVADGGPFRSYSLRVYSVNQVGQSNTFASVAFNNPQIGQLQNAYIEPMPNSVWFKCDRPIEEDFKAIRVWVSKTSGFTPSINNVVFDGDSNWVTISADNEGNPLESGVVYYLKAAGYDTYGDDNLTLTAELSVAVLSPAWGLLEGDIERSVLESGLRDEIEEGTTQITNIQNKYTVKINDSGHISGYGLISTANNATPFSEFIVVADRFALAPVATNPDAVDGSPFFVLTAPQVIDGTTIPAGTYMKKAFIHDATITTAKINDLAVTNAKISNLAVNSAKIADAAIITAKIGDAQITNAKIENASITTAKIADAQITSAKILDAQITSAKIAGSIQSNNYSATTGWLIDKAGGATFNQANIRGQINVGAFTGYAWPPAGQTGAHLSSQGFLIGNFNGGGKYFEIYTSANGATISTNIPAYIEDAQITNAKIANGAIDNAKIGDAQITTAKIGTAQIDTLRVAGNAITVQASVASFGSTSFSFNAAQGGQVLIVTYVDPAQFGITYTVRFNGVDVNYVTGVQYDAEQFLYTSETKIVIVNAVAGTNTVSLIRGSENARLVVCTAFLSMR